MDLKRAVIKALLYDYPLHLLADRLYRKDADVLEKFEDLVKWQSKEFSKGELKGLRKILEQDWMMTDPMEKTGVTCLYPYGIANLLSNVGNQLLTTDARKIPCVKFNQLLRWNQLTQYIDQDIMVSAYMASKFGSHLTNDQLIWDPVLRHNCKTLNDILAKGKSDVHNHLGASWEVFELSWVKWMNACDTDDEVLKAIVATPHQEADHIILPYDEQCIRGFKHYIYVAYVIRFVIFSYIEDATFVDDELIRKLYYCIIDSSTSSGLYSEFRDEAASYRHSYSAKFKDDRFVDYAIRQTDYNLLNEGSKSSPYIAFLGERRIMTLFLTNAYKRMNRAGWLMPFFHLYLLIKSKVRRCLILTDNLVGLDNFKDVNECKKTKVAYRFKTVYSIQSSLDRSLSDYLEGRLSPSAICEWQKINFSDSCLTGSNSYYPSGYIDTHLSYIATFNKKEDDIDTDECVDRHSELKGKNRERAYKLVKSNKVKVAGIDTCGNELFAQPEFFAHAYRFVVALRPELKNKLTYHVGEDFYDLVSGLRWIDETLRFLPLGDGCRLGHAVALGEDALSYYNERHYTCLAPKQILLDDIVWLIQKSANLNIVLDRQFKDWLLQESEKLYDEIGYRDFSGRKFSLNNYWQSMLLRGDDQHSYSPTVYENEWSKTAECSDKYIMPARSNKQATELWNIYGGNKDVRVKGAIVSEIKWHRSIAGVIKKIQDAMMALIKERNISIECCPTSNLHITHIKRYADHPITRFHEVSLGNGNTINVSINTDDRGLFATSLYNEYSLMALALLKEPHNRLGTTRVNHHNTIMDYIDKVRQMGNSMRF